MPRSRQNIHVMCLHTMAVHMYAYSYTVCVVRPWCLSVCITLYLSTHAQMDPHTVRTSKSLNQVITTCSYHYSIIYHACPDRSVVANWVVSLHHRHVCKTFMARCVNAPLAWHHVLVRLPMQWLLIFLCLCTGVGKRQLDGGWQFN